MLQVSVIGGGSWGTTIAKVIQDNFKNRSISGKTFLWVYPEVVNGVDLSESINSTRINSKYLPEILLPEGVTATSKMSDAVKDADILVFAVPHEFLDGILGSIISDKGAVVKKECIAVTLAKGLFFEEKKMELISARIKRMLGVEVCTLMGANIAGDVANGLFSECTLGYENESIKKTVVDVFNSKHFRVAAVKDHGAVEVCGALKNVVAVGCGIVAGQQQGVNTIAAVIRNGLLEMVRFCRKFVKSPDNLSENDETIPRVFFESCGVADLIVTCSSGRNYKYSKLASEKGISIGRIEKEEMNGQKLQGYSTIKDLLAFIKGNGVEKEFPFFVAICNSATSDLSAERIVDAIRESSQ
ncbi:glycerol-3-phosphate dehydrogenase (NAD+) [Nematocida ausubeli]|nr:glycerol-3-phosphate dehydrogenase (NAD+) [Nematocida ausubeli]